MGLDQMDFKRLGDILMAVKEGQRENALIAEELRRISQQNERILNRQGELCDVFREAVAELRALREAIAPPLQKPRYDPAKISG